MLRYTALFHKSRQILVYRPSLGLQAVPYRTTPCCLCTCKPQNPLKVKPDPCPSPPKSDKGEYWLWGTIAAFLVAGYCTVYARNNPEIRDWLTIYAPWFDDFIAVVYQENKFYKDSAIELLQNLIEMITNGEEPCDSVVVPVSNESLDEQKKAGEGDEKSHGKGKDACDIDRCIRETGDSMLKHYEAAKKVCADYNSLVTNSLENFTLSLGNKFGEERKKQQQKYELEMELARNDCHTVDELLHYAKSSSVGSEEQLRNIENIYNEYAFKRDGIMKDAMWENEKTVLYEKLANMVQTTVAKYANEIETLYPGLDYSDKKPTLQGDPDMLFVHTQKYVPTLQRELEKKRSSMICRIDRAIELMSKGGQNLVSTKMSERAAALRKEYIDKEKLLREQIQIELKEAPEKQQKEFNATFQERLQIAEKRINESIGNLVEERIEAEKEKLRNELVMMKQKLAELEPVLERRLKMDNELKRFQRMWSAGAALLAATNKGDPVVPVDKELRTIDKLSDTKTDAVVKTVLDALPQSVWDKGVVPLSVLQNSYNSMERVAMKVSMIDANGSPLPIYLVSYLQSLLLFMKLKTIPQKEVEKPPKAKDIQQMHLDTYDLLQRARYYVNHGNISLASLYVSALSGASRVAASSWLEAATAHIETKQAAEAVIAHATACSLQFL